MHTLTAAMAACTFAAAAWALGQPTPSASCLPPVAGTAGVVTPSPLPSQAHGYRPSVPTEFPGP